MAQDIEEIIRGALTSALQDENRNSSDASKKRGSNGGFAGIKGLAASAGAVALAPVAFKTMGKLAGALGVDSVGDLVKSPGEALEGAKSNLGDRLASSVKEKAKDAVDEAGGPGGMMKDAAKQMLPFGGGNGGGGKGGVEGVGKGRRMPVQQSVDIGIPIEAVYNQFTQFEDWPTYMHRVKRVTQEDDCTVSFAVKIWGKTKEFTAKIDTQRPDQRIKWKTSEGMTHAGVVTFHELGPSLTRVVLNFAVDPGSFIEKFARGSRYVKRAARADLHRFVAFIEMAEKETGAWRGVIEEGELVEEHDPSYDEQRQYSDIEELTGQADSDENEDGADQSEDEEQSPRATRSQGQQRARGRGRQARDASGHDRPRRSGRGRQSSGSGSSSSGRSSASSSGRSSRSRSGSSGRSQTRSRSSRESEEGGSASSRSSRQASSARGSSGRQSRGRSRSQSGNS